MEVKMKILLYITFILLIINQLFKVIVYTKPKYYKNYRGFKNILRKNQFYLIEFYFLLILFAHSKLLLALIGFISIIAREMII